MSREEEGGRGFEVEVKVGSSSLLIPPDELRCEFDECKNWRLEFCQLHYIEKLKKMKSQSKGAKRNSRVVETIEKNDGKKKSKKNVKGLKEKSELDDNGGVDGNGEKSIGKKFENGEEFEKIEVIVPVKKNRGNRNEVALMEKCDLDVNNGDDLVMKKDLESKLVQKRTEIRRSTRSMTVAEKNGNIITEKKSDEGGLDHGEDDKSGKSNLEVSEEEKKEVLVQKNEKKKKRQPSKNKGVEIPLKKEDGDGGQRMIVRALQAMPTGGAKNKKVSKKTVSFKLDEQNPKESKKNKKVELPVKKKTNEAKGSLAKNLDGALKVVKISSNEKQGTVSNVEDESCEDFEEAKVDFAGNVAGKEKKMKGCLSKRKDETVVEDKQTLEPKIEFRRSRRTTTGGSS